MKTKSELKNEKLVAAFKNFEDVCFKYVKFGATDSEPRAQFRLCVERAWRDGADIIAEQGDDVGRFWSLYTSSMNCRVAARAMNSAARKALKIILNTKVKDRWSVNEVAEYYWGENWCY